VLPLRDIVVFPHMIAPLFVGRRKKSILALEEVIRSDTFILLATQKNASDDDPATEAIYEIGTLASVLQLLKLPDGTVKVLVEGAERAKMVRYTDCSEYYEAEAVALGDMMGERLFILSTIDVGIRIVAPRSLLELSRTLTSKSAEICSSAHLIRAASSICSDMIFERDRILYCVL
jgi:ATP-dependent Lon protease